MANLSSEEKRILSAYREFFGENYSPSAQNTDIHVQTHKMCYFLNRIHCDIIDTGYVWNTFGPFSVCLQETLKQIDQDKDLLEAFYDDNTYSANNILDDNVLEGINKLRDGLQILNYKKESRHWIELLASLSFLAHSVLPVSEFDNINTELKARKNLFTNDDENQKAWSLLQELKVAY